MTTTKHQKPPALWQAEPDPRPDFKQWERLLTYRQLTPKRSSTMTNTNTNTTTTTNIAAMGLEEFIRRAVAEAQRSDVFVQTFLDHDIVPWLFPRCIGSSRGMLIDEPTLTPPGVDGVFAVACKFKQNLVAIDFRYLVYRTDEQINAIIEGCRKTGASEGYIQRIKDHGRSVEHLFTRFYPLRQSVW